MTQPSGRVLLDTNIVIAILLHEDAALSHLRQVDELFVSCVVLGELFFGAAKSRRANENIAVIEAYAAKQSVLPCDTEVARYYGQVKQRLKIKGRPIPENDIWIAATALSRRLTLITRDAHFDEVEGLLTTGWRTALD